MQLEYLRPEQLQLQPGDLPKKGRWPHIRAPRWPFNADLVSYDLLLTSYLPLHLFAHTAMHSVEYHSSWVAHLRWGLLSMAAFRLAAVAAWNECTMKL